MTTIKHLNLDALAEERFLTLHGVRYPMRDITVEDYALVTQEIEETDFAAMKQGDQMNFLVRMVLRYFPTLPEETLRKLTPDRVNLILQFARKEMDEQLNDQGEIKGKND